MSLKPLITVFGATGTQGGSVARALLQLAERPFRIRAVTRHPGSAAAQDLAERGAEIIAADFDDLHSVQRALRGAYGAFCVTSFWEHRSPERELRQAGRLAEAARRACVGHVIWSTQEDTRRFIEPDGEVMPVLMGRYNVPHFDAKGYADQFFIGRGLPVTRLVSAFLWDWLVASALQPQHDAEGRRPFVLPLGNALLPGIAAADFGACTAALFCQGEAAIGRRVGVAAEHLSGAQMATRLACTLGEPVCHLAVDPADYARLGHDGAAELANMFRFVRDFNDEFCAVRNVAAARALHPALMTFDGFLAKHFSTRPRDAALG